MADARQTQPQPARVKTKRLSTALFTIRVLALCFVVLTLKPLETQAQSLTPPGMPLSGSSSASEVQRWVSAEGESIVSMAQAMFPRDEGARSFFVSRVLRANPGLLRSGLDAHSPLPTGTELVIPSLLDLAGAATLPPARSTSPLNLRPTPVAQQPTQQALAAPTTIEATQRDQLVIDTGGRDALATELLLGQVSVTDRERELRLVAAIDRNINLQRELLERIKRLEEVQDEIRRRLNQPADIASGDQAPVAQAPTASGPVATEVESQPAPQTDRVNDSGITNTGSTGWLTWMLGGIAMSLLALMLWQRSQLKARQYHSYRENPNEDLWPDEAQSTAGFEPEVKTLPPGKNNPQRLIGTASPARKTNPPEKAPRATRAARARPGTAPSLSTMTAGQRAAVGKGTSSLADDDSTLPPETFNKNAADSFPDDVPTQPPTVVQAEEPDEDVSAVELADLMLGFGRVDGAADALEAFIENNPRAAVKPWLKLTEVYHAAGKRQEFETVAANLHKTFNVQLPIWDDFGQTNQSTGVESMPHITDRLEAIWGTRECQGYIDTLIRDNRQGTRSGFDLDVLDDLLMLASVLDAQLGRFRSTHGLRN